MPTPFPLNAWYAAAWDVDLKQALFPRTICGKHVVMYRQSNGRVAALEDACWHRLVPLSKGRLEGDTVVCGYHGLKYNSQGRCTFMPSQETINPSACVRAYPVVERHRYIWLWMGDPALADPALVPDLHWNHDPAWAGGDYAPGPGPVTGLGIARRTLRTKLQDLGLRVAHSVEADDGDLP